MLATASHSAFHPTGNPAIPLVMGIAGYGDPTFTSCVVNFFVFYVRGTTTVSWTRICGTEMKMKQRSLELLVHGDVGEMFMGLFESVAVFVCRVCFVASLRRCEVLMLNEEMKAVEKSRPYVTRVLFSGCCYVY